MQHERMMSVISTAYACIPHLSQSRSMKHEVCAMILRLVIVWSTIDSVFEANLN